MSHQRVSRQAAGTTCADESPPRLRRRTCRTVRTVQVRSCISISANRTSSCEMHSRIREALCRASSCFQTELRTREPRSRAEDSPAPSLVGAPPQNHVLPHTLRQYQHHAPLADIPGVAEACPRPIPQPSRHPARNARRGHTTIRGRRPAQNSPLSIFPPSCPSSRSWP